MTLSRDLSVANFRDNDVVILKREVLSHAYGRLDRFTLKHRKYDGSWSETFTRELYDSGDAATVLPYDPKNGLVALVEQFRMAPFAHGHMPWMVETIAGRLDGVEQPDDAVRREAKEEAGLVLDELIRITSVYAAPGIFNEYVHLFCARARLDQGVQTAHGLSSEHEDIRLIIVPFEDALKALQSGHIRDATTAICLQWLALNRETVTARWI